MALWAKGETYRDIAGTIMGLTVGKVAAAIRNNRKDGYSKPKGPLLNPRSTPTILRTPPTVHEMKGRNKNGRRTRGSLQKKGFSRYDLLQNALRETDNIEWLVWVRVSYGDAESVTMNGRGQMKLTGSENVVGVVQETLKN